MATTFLSEIPELECSEEVIQGLVGILVRSSLLGRNVSLNRGSGSLKPTTASKGLLRWHYLMTPQFFHVQNEAMNHVVTQSVLQMVSTPFFQGPRHLFKDCR